MNAKLYKIAAKHAKLVYKESFDIGVTEFLPSLFYCDNELIQILSIAGTNEALDWFDNFNIMSKKGIKKSAYTAACEINKLYRPDNETKLLVTGHSAGATTAIAYKRLFGADYCISFCPARSLRYWTDRKMENTTVFIDPDDPVPKLGCLSFGHPVCERILLPDDHKGLFIKDHFLNHIENFIDSNFGPGWCDVN